MDAAVARIYRRGGVIYKHAGRHTMKQMPRGRNAEFATRVRTRRGKPRWPLLSVTSRQLATSIRIAIIFRCDRNRALSLYRIVGNILKHLKVYS